MSPSGGVDAMADGDEFADLMRRVRAGDSGAAAELVRTYGSAIRREARLGLGQTLRPVFDSMDLFQSVLGSFFVRAVAGQFEIDSPRRLVGLLVKMTRNKVREKARRRREIALDGYDPPDDDRGRAADDTDRDLLGEVRKRLSDEESAIWERRCRGLRWNAIAAELGGTAVARRKQLSRAVRRIAQDLGWEGGARWGAP